MFPPILSILAHCMGLGKTFSIVSLSVLLLTHPELNYKEKPFFSRILVVAPVNTIENWACEFKKWVPEKMRLDIPVHRLNSSSDMFSRLNILDKWFDYGGVCIIGYDMFRTLVEIKPPSPSDASSASKNSVYYARLQKVNSLCLTTIL